MNNPSYHEETEKDYRDYVTGKGNLLNGEKDGFWIFFDKSGNTTKEANFQDGERFGKWVKITIEFKPSRKSGFRRLWVDDQMVVEENNVQTIWDSTTSKTFSLKFGIYQGIESGGKNPPAIRNDDQQSIQFKDIHFKRI